MRETAFSGVRRTRCSLCRTSRQTEAVDVGDTTLWVCRSCEPKIEQETE